MHLVRRCQSPPACPAPHFRCAPPTQPTFLNSHPPGSSLPISASMSSPTMPRSMSPQMILRTTSAAGQVGRRAAGEQGQREFGAPGRSSSSSSSGSSMMWVLFQVVPCRHAWQQRAAGIPASARQRPWQESPWQPPRTGGSLEPDLQARQLRDAGHILPRVGLDHAELAVLQQAQQAQQDKGWPRSSRRCLRRRHCVEWPFTAAGRRALLMGLPTAAQPTGQRCRPGGAP